MVSILPMEKGAPTTLHCSHGPTLLFERFDQTTKSVRQFYACAAFRDRKACPFFQWADSDEAVTPTDSHTEQYRKIETHHIARKRFHRFKQLSQDMRRFCSTCGLLLLEDDVPDHNGHQIKSGISLKMLKRPTFLFAALDNNKTYAQYLFSKSCVDFVIGILQDLHMSHVLCVGAPRIHETIQTEYKGTLKSMLLDLDHRYAQIYPPSKFARYNMFNHHFFERDGETKAACFLRENPEQTILVTDPPFGGMVEPLAKSFSVLSQMWHHSSQSSKLVTEGHMGQDSGIPIVWFFPYFLESKIISQYPGMAMLDYKVPYDNHSVFKNNKKQKGSPVRIFTNISQALFKLPESEGYWYCEKCKRFSSGENRHCDECKACTSKDGTTYNHCDMCMRCVKPSRVHCFKCDRCEMADHKCGEFKGQGCHICGAEDHKRRDCPQKALKGKSHKAQVMGIGKRKMTKAAHNPRKKRKK